MVACAIIHLYTYIPGRRIDSAWLPIILSATCILTFLPVVKIIKSVHADGYRFDLWERALMGGPTWVPMALVLLLLYTGFNFFFSLVYLNEGLSPLNTNGSFMMMDHGRFVRSLSEAEYYRHRAYEIRGITTHPILFHAVAAAVMYAKLKRMMADRQTNNIS